MHTVLPMLHPHFVTHLPADANTSNTSRSIEHAAYSWVNPTPTKAAIVICTNHVLAAQLGFHESALRSTEFSQLVTGNTSPESLQGYAMNYGGHQFGQWAGQLGDGRAINLGQYHVDKQRITLQLKGAGKTPYSRRGDGMAVLRSSIREYLCSEAMFHLGIPTTRALSLSVTGETVMRDKLYDGHAAYEPAAIVARTSASFLRFGSVQLPAARGDLSLLKQTVEFSINNDYPQLLPTSGKVDKSVYLTWFAEISERTAHLIVQWMRVGFVHGVLNTDNMSLLGETIDYGPYGWVDSFDLNWTPNTSDTPEKRYRFGQQGYIGQWNLFQLANAIYPLIEDAAPLQAILKEYNHLYQQKWLAMMAGKLGFTIDSDNQKLTKSDLSLCNDLELLLSLVETDMTLFYRHLATYNITKDGDNFNQLTEHFSECYYKLSQIDNDYLSKLSDWLIRYQIRLTIQGVTDAQRKVSMNQVNPCYILRNFQVQQAIEQAEKGDYSGVIILAELLKTPYQEQSIYQKFAVKRPDWAIDKFGCSALSCSS